MTASTNPTPPPSAEPSGFTILCVDDEPNILSALRRLFPHHYVGESAAPAGEAGAPAEESAVPAGEIGAPTTTASGTADEHERT